MRIVLDDWITGEVIYWRGPAPFYYVPVPEAVAARIKAVSAEVSYGWGVIPATVTIGDTEFTTSLFPKDGGYLVPLKVAVRKAEGIEDGEAVTLRLVLAAPGR
jgi:hypothetical protein